jgi:hypothetical protein
MNKKLYLEKANHLFSRLLDEQPEDTTEDPTLPETETKPVDVYFNSLDEETQKSLMDALRSQLNVTEDDKFGNQKIVQALSKKPLFSLTAEEVVRQLNIDI